MTLERHFEKFRKNIVGQEQEYLSPYGIQRVLYVDWIASGRLYAPIEDKIKNEFGPFVGNTHTESSENGRLMTKAYTYAHQLIKDHVNAGPRDVIITAGSGMTGAIVKFQRILGLKNNGYGRNGKYKTENERPVVFITHMEHHSNQTSWYATDADVVVIEPGGNLLVDPLKLEEALLQYKERH
jgi:selenocysteine lyase/cysteine desulfurase